VAALLQQLDQVGAERVSRRRVVAVDRDDHPPVGVVVQDLFGEGVDQVPPAAIHHGVSLI
jgi:hypothetical protein